MAEISQAVIDTLIAEAIGEGPEGMRRVAETILNRAAIRGLTPEQVVKQPKQYTGYEAPGADTVTAMKDPAVRAAAEAAFRLAMEPGDPTKGADHYFNPNLVSPSWARSMTPTGQYKNHAYFSSQPVPPGEIPNVVASAVDTVPPRTPVMPTPLPPMLAAQRNLQPTSQNTSAFYAGILPPPAPRAPITDKDLIFDRGVADTVERSIAGQDQNLAAILERRIAEAGQKATMSTAAISYAGQERAPASRPMLSNAMGQTYAGQERGPATAPSVGAVAQPQRLPELPPSQVASLRMVSTSMQRAANAVDPRLQQALEQRAQQASMVDTSMQRVASAVDPALQRALEARTAPGVGLPPSTRSVASVPMPASTPRPTGPALSRDSVAQSRLGNEAVQRLGSTAFAAPSLPAPQLPAIPNAIPGPARVPQVADRLAPGTWGLPDETLMASGVVPNAVPGVPGVPMPRPRPLRTGVNVTMPTLMGQRPTLPMPRSGGLGGIFGMPTPVSQRPNSNALRVQVNGAGSYGGGSSGGSGGSSGPQTITGSSTGRTYNVGQQYQAGGYRFEAQSDGTFKNLGRI